MAQLLILNGSIMFRTIFDLYIDLPTAKYFIKTIVRTTLN